MSTVNGFQVGSETLKYNYEALENYNTPNFSTSSSTTYAVGDYVMYNGKLYKCTTATTGGTWVDDNWTETVLSDDVSDLTRQISDLENAVEFEKTNVLPAVLECFKNVVYTSSSGAVAYNKLQAMITNDYVFYDYLEYIGTYDVSMDKAIIAEFPQSAKNTIELKVCYSGNASGYNPIIGNRIAGTKNFALYIESRSQLIGYWWSTTDTLNRNIPIGRNTINNVVFKPVGKSSTYPENVTVTINGVEYNTGANDSSGEWGNYFGIFAPASTRSASSQPIYPFGQQIGEIIVKDEDDNIIADLKPAFNGTYYGYLDLVTYNFYCNESHNDFYIGGNWQ